MNDLNKMRLETPRLIIEPLRVQHSAFILNLLNSPGWLEFIGDRKVTDLQTAEGYIQKMDANANAHFFVYSLRVTNDPIGILTIIKRDEYPFPDLGFAQLPEYENKGYAGEASEVFMREVLQLTQWDVLMAITKPDNLKSIKLLGKLGFKLNQQTESLSIFERCSITDE